MSDKTLERTFAPETFDALLEDLKSGRLPLARVTLSDNQVTGLRAILRSTGGVSFHVQYDIGESRPYLKLGEHPAMAIPEARKLARTVQRLAANGIDVQDGLHMRLVKELKTKGAKWRP